MDEKKCIKEIKKNFRDDIKGELNPLYNIEQSVHSSTTDELEDLFEAIGSFAFKEGYNQRAKDMNSCL